jgi:murein DD-endopeptidase MepM/ murein hydrolase activator NlpD
MSGFDVSRADAHRTRGLVAAASLSLSALLLIALMTGREPQSDAAPIEPNSTIEMAAGSESAAAVASQDTASVVPTLSAPARFDPVELNDNAFTFCASCATTIQVEREVPRGGTLAGLLDDAGIDRIEAARAVSALNTVYDLRYLRAGERIRLYVETMPAAADGQDAAIRLNGLSFRPDVERSITVARTYDDDFRARETHAQFDRETVRSAGTITSSLYVDALNAGATDRVVVELAGVLAYAIDFQRSIQPGDGFDIVFDRFIDEEGNVARTGDILYARYEGRGEPKEFFRYETEDGIVGYYTADGASAQRLLMLTPINGARLSSHFSSARRHPILGYTRRHNGTDFAAPRGTPILAAGNGVVERANRYGSFGNYIRIRHANGYQTAYAHLNGFARGITAGTRVTQGQVIGYVGTTGRSTGPHLHYEVHHNGTPRNPMTLDLPTGRQLNESEIALFEAERDRILAIRDAARPAADTDQPLMADAGNGAQ